MLAKRESSTSPHKVPSPSVLHMPSTCAFSSWELSAAAAQCSRCYVYAKARVRKSATKYPSRTHPEYLRSASHRDGARLHCRDTGGVRAGAQNRRVLRREVGERPDSGAAASRRRIILAVVSGTRRREASDAHPDPSAGELICVVAERNARADAQARLRQRARLRVDEVRTAGCQSTSGVPPRSLLLLRVTPLLLLPFIANCLESLFLLLLLLL